MKKFYREANHAHRFIYDNYNNIFKEGYYFSINNPSKNALDNYELFSKFRTKIYCFNFYCKSTYFIL